ncbi:nodulation protein NfeD [Bacillus spongiae]|uniref:Nodulation protein NfeD n=1 Tax=Bacillus spongiae TaxID=2683610 RepID=A0ABU8H927_9BACI
MKKIVPILLLLMSIGLMVPAALSAQNEKVAVVPLHNEVEKGLAQFLKRAVNEAEEAGAETIIFDIDTPGGLVDAAGDISQMLQDVKMKKVAFVNDEAISAGAFLALNADEIYMVPSARMGAAAIIDQEGNTAGKKAESYWLTTMETAAENSDRDPIYALAMADEDIDLPDLNAPKGKLLTLNAQSALEVGYSNGTVKNLDELLTAIGLEDAELISIEESFAEKLARFITNPIVVPILLSIASLGFIVELYSPGIGIPGAMGLTALLLFFYGHLVAGLAGFESLILFVIGVILIIVEFFIPGGIAAILGVAAIIGSIIMAGGNVVYMGISLLIALFVAIIAMVVFVKVFGKKMNLFNKIILKDSTSTEGGYVTNLTRHELIGLVGITTTPLRPAGTMMIDDERIDVVSEGSFIAQNVEVKVIKTEGARIIVRELVKDEGGN